MLFSRTTFQVADLDRGISNSLFLSVLFKLKMTTCTKFPRLATLPKHLVSSDRRQDMSGDWRHQVKTRQLRVDLGRGPVCPKPLSHDQDADCPQKKCTPLAGLGQQLCIPEQPTTLAPPLWHPFCVCMHWHALYATHWHPPMCAHTGITPQCAHTGISSVCVHTGIP